MSTPAATSAPQVKPYKGPESYQVEDGSLFFGRDGDADRLIAKILSSRFTLVHAQSGAGKTSLLNARIIPGLETRGWSTFRVLPHNDPIDSLRAATLKHLLPHPEAERRAVKHAWDSLRAPEPVPTLDELIDAYEGLPIRDPRRRALIAPVRMPAGHAAGHETESVNPFFCRLLRSGVEVEAFAEHLAAIAPTQPIDGRTPVTRVLGLLSEQRFVSAYGRLRNELNVPGRSLTVFFQHLFRVYGGRRTNLGIVLLLDQFEELFTRFTDPGQVASDEAKRDRPDWRLRYEFFAELQSLYAARSHPHASGRGEAPVLPIRFVISMRDEYIAQLGGMRLEENAYHLNLLETEQATDAIKEPAALFGYTYEGRCFDLIIKELTKEERYVEPAHLQLVCEKLWNEQGKELAGRDGGATGDELPTVGLDTFERLGKTFGIMKAFLDDFLNGLSEAERLEVIELLEPLVTERGTRNIVQREQLVNAPFRDGARRRALLDKLVDHTIVRTEPRLGGHFVEITHEFLIEPISQAIAKALSRDPEYRRYRQALRTLERLQDDGGAGPRRQLPQPEFNTLHQHRAAVHWDAWGAEVMLRNAIAHCAPWAVLLVWLTMFADRAAAPTLETIFSGGDAAGGRGRRRDLLSLAELRCVNSQRGGSLELTPEQLELVWRSQLTWAVDDEREDVRYWTERMISNG